MSALDLSDFVDPTDDGPIGEEDPIGFVDAPGEAHLKLIKYEGFPDGKNMHRFTWECVEHKDQKQRGRRVVDRVQHPQADHNDGGKFCMKSLVRRAIAIGITTVEEVERLKGEGKLPPISFEGREGGQCFATLKFGKEYQGERRIEVNGIFPVSDKRCVNFPRNAAFLAAAGVTAPAAAPAAPSASTSNATATTPATSQAPATPKPAGNPFGAMT